VDAESRFERLDEDLEAVDAFKKFLKRISDGGK
jgi:hypothetical protein